VGFEPPEAAHEGNRYLVDTTLAAAAADVVDLGRGRLFGIEFKAGAAPTREDARHLVWLRDELGQNFAGGGLLHSGQAVIELDDRAAAVPLSAPWASAAGS
jgi:hypothetical protein